MAANMAMVSPEMVYSNLSLLEQVDVVTSAIYRQLAQDTLADPAVSLSLRQAIADRLNGANRNLGITAASNNDSY